MRVSKAVPLSALPFVAATGGMVSLAVFVHPDLRLGAVMLAGELLFGGLTLHKLWPKNKSASRS